mmetsp:Transcript_55397/g.118120  ORF Transcript_55397/g.118120 Transcript_55397/m.118120 type:complete len:207 (-) Transcript_55397:761-1381(-)
MLSIVLSIEARAFSFIICNFFFICLSCSSRMCARSLDSFLMLPANFFGDSATTLCSASTSLSWLASSSTTEEPLLLLPFTSSAAASTRSSELQKPKGFLEAWLALLPLPPNMDCNTEEACFSKVSASFRAASSFASNALTLSSYSFSSRALSFLSSSSSRSMHFMCASNSSAFLFCSSASFFKYSETSSMELLSALWKLSAAFSAS